MQKSNTNINKGPVYRVLSFNYESECRRIDAPKEDMGVWLENISLEDTRIKYKGNRNVEGSYLKETPDKYILFFVRLRGYICGHVKFV